VGASAALIVKGSVSGQGSKRDHKGRVEPPGRSCSETVRRVERVRYV
jgi:hypothetical protein